MKLAVVLIHGIGDQSKDWSKDICETLRKKVFSRIVSLSPTTPPTEADEIISISSVYWADVFKEREKNLQVILQKFTEGNKKPVDIKGNWYVRLQKWIVLIVVSVLKSIQGVVISNYVGDVIGYLNHRAQEQVHAKVTEAVRVLLAEKKDAKIPITFVSHSLGTVICSNYIYDLRQRNKPNDKAYSDSIAVDNIFTIGAPIALFAVQYSGPEEFGSPIKSETDKGRWVNIFDDDDPVGMPLKPLNAAYNDAVYRDVIVDAGIYGLSHTEYFSKSETLDIVANKLAIDWLAMNAQLDEQKLKDLYEAYDKNFMLNP